MFPGVTNANKLRSMLERDLNTYFRDYEICELRKKQALDAYLTAKRQFWDKSAANDSAISKYWDTQKE